MDQKNGLLIVALMLLLFSCTNHHQTKKQAAFKAFLYDIMIEYHLPGLAVAVISDGKLIAVEELGLRRVDLNTPIQTNDSFHVGSVSKPISTTVIATLVEEGILSWDTSIKAVFPELVGVTQNQYHDVSIKQLLAHRGGILAWEEDEEIALFKPEKGSARNQRYAAVTWLLNQTPVAEPGTAHVYSNAGYMIAAAMAEKVTGKAWETLVIERLAVPLDLESLGFGWPAKEDADQPWGHYMVENNPIPHHLDDLYAAGPLLVPAGDIHMNIRDLASIAQLHLDGLQEKARLLRPETFAELHNPMGDYALGWNIRSTASHHLGGLGTFLSAIWISVPRNIAVVISTNTDADNAIASKIISESIKTFNTESQ